MSNSYTNCSFAFAINGPEEAEWMETILDAAERITGKEDEEGKVKEIFPEWDEWMELGFEYKIRCEKGGGTVQVMDDGENVNLEHVVRFLRAYLKRFNIDKVIGFDWANTGDEFSGGAVVVSKDSEKWMTTRSWLEETMKGEVQ